MSNFKPTIKKVFISLVLSIVFGILGLFFYFWGSCGFVGDTSCAAYSQIKIFFAYVFVWPILIMQKLMIGNSNNFDTVVNKNFGWLALWVYYYLVVCIAIVLVQKKDTK